MAQNAGLAKRIRTAAGTAIHGQRQPQTVCEHRSVSKDGRIMCGKIVEGDPFNPRQIREAAERIRIFQARREQIITSGCNLRVASFDATVVSDDKRAIPPLAVNVIWHAHYRIYARKISFLSYQA